MIQFSSATELKKRKEADLLVFPFWKHGQKVSPAAVMDTFAPILKVPVDAGDFEGKVGETILLYSKGGKEKRLLLLGLGKQDEVSVETYRRAYSDLAKLCQTMRIAKVSIVLPTLSKLHGDGATECLTGISEGLLLTNYRFENLHSVKEETVLLKSVQFIGVTPKRMEIVEEAQTIAEGVYLARDLTNGNAHEVTPEYLAQVAKKIAAKHAACKVTILDRAQIIKEKMGLLAAVSSGSAVEPRFIVLSYKGNPRSKEHTVIIGKGITYDTGGLNLKPTGSMETMRDDMSGGGVALATLATVANLGLKVNVTAVVPSTENAITDKSFKPGDVYTAHDGTTVEIGNTDAEGRLVLADAISYTQKYLEPTCIIDFATLTGAMVVALGNGIAGFFTDDDTLAQRLLDSSHATHESLWRMPLFAPYEEKLKSEIADICNIGGRPAGSITAALFLKHFVNKKLPWAHIDIAGTAFLDKEFGYWPKNGVGFGVRLMINFLSS